MKLVHGDPLRVLDMLDVNVTNTFPPPPLHVPPFSFFAYCPTPNVSNQPFIKCISNQPFIISYVCLFPTG